MGKNKILCTNEDLSFAKKEINKLAKRDFFANQLLSENNDLIIHFSEINTPIDVDVLIIEDNISFICKYMKVLHEMEGTKFVVACTSSVAVQYLISLGKLKDKSRIKLVFLDFDLDQLVDSSQSAANALHLYNFICDNLTHNFKLYGLTGFEGHYDVKDFKTLENEMKRRNDDVFNKSLVDDSDSFLKNLVRNVINLFEPENIPSKLNVDAFSPPRKKTTLSPPKDQPNYINLKKAKSFINRLEAAINSISPNHERFIKNHHFNKIEKSGGGFYSSYQTIDSFVKQHAKTINYILNNSPNDEFLNVKYQIKEYNLFLRQGIRLN